MALNFVWDEETTSTAQGSISAEVRYGAYLVGVNVFDGYASEYVMLPDGEEVHSAYYPAYRLGEAARDAVELLGYARVMGATIIERHARQCFHLTLTGLYAGQTYCGIPRGLPGARYGHLPYDDVEGFLEREDLCPNCRKVYRETA